jgi:hypothetical protein
MDDAIQGGHAMSRSTAALLPFLVVFSWAGAAHAQLDAPVWYVQYEAKLHTNFTQAGTGMRGGITTVYKIEHTFTNTSKLDMRNPGAVISLDVSKLTGADYTKLSPQEQLKISQQMLDGMQYTANWMQGPMENVDDTDAMHRHMLDVSVPIRISYEETSTGNNLVNEVGTHYDMWEQTTASYSGSNVYASPDQVKFEMNTKTKQYWLVLPFAFQDMNNLGSVVPWVTVRKSRATGAAAWDPEERTTSKTGIDVIGGGFRLKLPPTGFQAPVIEGTLDGSGRISGTKSFTGHMDRPGADVPVTLTYTYTVTQTPPAAAAKK